MRINAFSYRYENLDRQKNLVCTLFTGPCTLNPAH